MAHVPSISAELFLSAESKSDLAKALGVPPKKMSYILYVKHGYSRDDYYKIFDISKKNGGTRQIESPSSELKYIQYKLKEILFYLYQSKKCVYGYIENKSILDNAKIHSRKKHVLNVDLKNFFPSITAKRIYGLLKSRPYCIHPEVAYVVTQIVTYDSRLPQGAPTSPILSNMICAKLDSDLQQLANRHKCLYSRYADDITFSTNQKEFPNCLLSNSDGIADPVGMVVECINKNGFEINLDKLRLQSNITRQVVTGLTVNKFPNVSRKFIRQIRGMIHACKKFGVEAAGQHHLDTYYSKNKNSEGFDFLSVIKGKIDFVKMVRGRNDVIYQKLHNSYLEIPEAYGSKKNYRALYSPLDHGKNYIFTEGMTDWKHLSATLSFFKKQGEFLDLNIQFYKYGQREHMGATNLIKRCEHVALDFSNGGKKIFLFDNDDKEAVKFVKSNEYRHVGGKAFAALLPVPKFRHGEEVCIELLYRDADLMTEIDGRRMFLNCEFEVDTGEFKDCQKITYGINAEGQRIKKWNSKLKSKHAKILDSNVFDTSDIPPKSIALSKNDFASAVIGRSHFVNEFDLSGFREVFVLIGKILNE